MAFILSVLGKTPTFGADCFVAPNATIVGDVVMGNEGSVWFNAVIRGDVNSIVMGNKVNVQDGAVNIAPTRKMPPSLEIMYLSGTMHWYMAAQ